MKKIEMVDLAGQYHNIKQELDGALLGAIEKSVFIGGDEVKHFATELAEYIGIGNVIPCANGTDALQLALMATGARRDCEVIVPAFNYVATAEVIALLGMKPVFVDNDPNTFAIDPAKIEDAITSRTKAIMPVHVFGQCADMEAINNLGRQYNVLVIEDNAQAIGAQYTFSDGEVHPAGGMGHVGTTSFFPSKNLGCMGDGGAVYTNDNELATVIQSIANHGQRKKYDYIRIGVNSRLDTIQAAILRVKLRHLEQYTKARQEAAAAYDKLLAGVAGVTIPYRDPKSTHVFHQYTLKIAGGRRDKVKAALAEQGIPSMIYYPSPLHLQEAYGYLGYQPGSMPVAEQLCKEVLSLPMHTELSQEQQEFIVAHLVRALA